MGKIIRFLFLSITAAMGILFLAIQVIHLGVTHDPQVSFDYRFLLLGEDFILLKVVGALIGLMTFQIFYATFFGRSGHGAKGKHKRALTSQEKKQFSDVANWQEIKRNSQRLEYDNTGHLKTRSILIWLDHVLDPFRRFWNECCTILKVSDKHRKNTIRTYEIAGKKTNFRGGIPLAVKWNRLYVDAGDNHAIINASSNAGKTVSFVNPMIDALRMTGESMIINDPKGELLYEHKEQLLSDGYDVRVINYIHPEEGDRYSPLSIVIDSYRKAEKEYLESKEEYTTKIKEYLDKINAAEGLQKQRIENELLEYKKYYAPEFDYSKAAMFLRELADQFFYDPKAHNEAHFNDQASSLFQGIVFLLLEEKSYNPDSKKREPVPDEEINFKSVMETYRSGMETVMVKAGATVMKVPKLKFLLEKKRKKTDESYKKLMAFLSTGDKERGSIVTSFENKMKDVTLNETVLRMMAKSDFDVADIGRKKTALFIVVHGEKDTYYRLVSLIINQTFQLLMQLTEEQQKKTGKKRLPVPCNLIFDEFGNFPALKNIKGILTFSRSAGFRSFMVVQDLHQFSEIYGRDVESIIENNSANFIYLYGKDMDTIKRISAMSGKKLVWKSDKGSYEEAPVISTDQLQQLSMGDAVIISARKKAYIFRMRNYKKYSFYKNKKKYVPGETRRLRNVRVYNVQEHYDADQKINDAFDSKKDLLSGEPQLSAELKTGVEQLQEKQSLIPTTGFGLGAAK